MLPSQKDTLTDELERLLEIQENERMLTREEQDRLNIIIRELDNDNE